MKRAILLTTLFVLILGNITGQILTQSIQGKIVDTETHLPIPGVNVTVVDSQPLLGTVSDVNGNYLIEKVPLGRISLLFSFLGYDPIMMRELELRSGKELVVNIELKESFQQINEVTVKPAFRKDKANNNMASLSSRSFNVEEASRYAGGWNDPSRLAGSFAGVTMAEGVNDNAIVIRGNAPKGILWRLEGVDIPAPNHLNGVNNGGGIETIFSVNMLDNSDFYTGAFPAEYGNAMSGVFDMNFRNGSADHLQGTFQVGSQGIDICAEGPFRQEGKGSFLLNYRYSTMGLVGVLLDGDFGLPTYQDLSFKIHLPTTIGDFSAWGISGLSSVAFDPDEDEATWTNTFDNNQYSTQSDLLATGLSHQLQLGAKSYMKSSLAFSYDKFEMQSNQWQHNGVIIHLADHHENNKRILANSFINHKFGNRHTNKIGVRFIHTDYTFNVNGNPDQTVGSDLINISKQSGGVNQWQGYTQSKWRINPFIDLLAGFNVSYYDFNNELIVEPRISASWRFIPKHSLSLAYGLNSRPEPFRFYEAQSSLGDDLNPKLKVTKSHHLVVGYDVMISEIMKLKFETYYQYLFDVPVIPGTSYSLINYQWNDYYTEAMNNDGKGHNFGFDMTLERYLQNGYYYMLTMSVFDSKYVGADGVERNTSFNRNFVINTLYGKEWNVKENNTFGINGKMAFMGGNRFTPADQELSRQNEMVILDESRAFEWQESPKLFVDLGLTYKINKQKTSHAITLQAKNLFAQKEMFGWAYDFDKQTVVEHGIAMIYPFFTYRVQF